MPMRFITIGFESASMAHLVLLPHGCLHGIPLATLPIDGTPGGRSFADSLSCGITTVPSFHVLQRARASIRPLALQRWVAIREPRQIQSPSLDF